MSRVQLLEGGKNIFPIMYYTARRRAGVFGGFPLARVMHPRHSLKFRRVVNLNAEKPARVRAATRQESERIVS